MSKFLHLGSGPIHIDGWLNVDLVNPAADVHLDMTNGLVYNFGENHFDICWCCHALEHLEYPNGIVSALNEIYKSLKPGGTFRLAVPDLDIMAQAYVNGSDLKFLYSSDFPAYYYKDHPAERAHFFVTAWQHKMLYSFSLMSELLRDAGFKDIRKMAFGQSRLGQWSHDRFEQESMYVECTK